MKKKRREGGEGWGKGGEITDINVIETRSNTRNQWNKDLKVQKSNEIKICFLETMSKINMYKKLYCKLLFYKLKSYLKNVSM